MNITFHGVRGSAAVAGRATARYGAHTACVAVEVPKRDPILLDLGSGVSRWVAGLDPVMTTRVHALVSHGHVGHVEGRPALQALASAGVRVDVYGPRSMTPPAARALSPAQRFARARAGRWGGNDGDGYRVVTVEDEELAVGDAKVLVRSVPHDGPTNGYRLDWDGVSVAYVSDHQAPPGLDTIAPEVLELADRVDLLIHDAQLPTASWAERSGGGHSTVDYAVLVAREAGARRLALFHHDPDHGDDDIDCLVVRARRTAERLGVDEVFGAAEGTTVALGR